MPCRFGVKRTAGTTRVGLFLGGPLSWATTRPPPSRPFWDPNTPFASPSCTGRIGFFVDSLAHRRLALSGQRVRALSMALAYSRVAPASRKTTEDALRIPDISQNGGPRPNSEAPIPITRHGSLPEWHAESKWLWEVLLLLLLFVVRCSSSSFLTALA